MDFEAKVMKVVDEVLGKDALNGFTFGTLFVVALPEKAEALLSKLSTEFGKVQMQRGLYCEYSYDFVA